MRILTGNLLEGILVILVSSALISSIENILRPLILRDRIQLHPLIIFFSILGGINVFGINGIIIGPMAMIIFLTVFDLFLTEHKLENN
jgi:predicted PurR-regulated permease PerM